MQEYFDRAADLFALYSRDFLALPESVRGAVTDMRLTVGHRPTLYLGRKALTLPAAGVLTAAEMEELIYKLCDYSVYKHVEEIRKGFIAVKGGFRVGLCGSAVVKDGEIENIAAVTSLTVRIPHHVADASAQLRARVGDFGGGVLLVGEPSSGKTTVLRDLMVTLGQWRLAVLDERLELTGGMNLPDLPVLCGYPKSAGILQVIRNLGAELVLCDELELRDLRAVEACVASGVSMIATVHGHLSGIQRPLVRRLVDTGAFEQIVQLKGRDRPGEIHRIWKAGEWIEGCRGNAGDFGRSGRRIYPHAGAWPKN